MRKFVRRQFKLLGKHTPVVLTAALALSSCCLNPTNNNIASEIYHWTDEGAVALSPYSMFSDDDETLVVVDDDVSIGTMDEALAEQREILDWLREQDDDAVRAVLPIPRESIADSEEGSDDVVLEAIVDTRNRRQWNNGRIRFRVNPAPPGGVLPANLRAAVANWNSVSNETGLTWVFTPGLDERDSGVRFDFNAGGGCNSKIGRHFRRQDINLGPGCNLIAVIMHEMGHAMGLHHEHRREGRGNWVAHLGRNYTGARFDVRTIKARPRIETRGRFDVDSIMQYTSVNAFSRAAVLSPVAMPIFLSRLEWSIANSMGLGQIGLQTRQYNNAASLGFRGVDFENVVVDDVDFDGLDDVIAGWSNRLYYSSAGQTGWQPVRPGGRFVNARIDRADQHSRLGDFDNDGEVDVLQIVGNRWTLHGSSVAGPVSRNIVAARYLQVADINGDGIDDAMVFDSDGRWWQALGPDILGSARRSALPPISPLLVASFKLANLSGTVQVIVRSNGHLVYSNAALGRWVRLFPGNNLGQLDLADVTFIDLDGDDDDDMVLPAPGGALQPPNADVGHPVFMLDPLGSPAPTAYTAYTYNVVPAFGIDLRAGNNRKVALVGQFTPASAVSFLTFGLIDGQPVAAGNSFPTRSDSLGVGTVYDPVGMQNVAALADKHPVQLAGARLIRQPTNLVLQPGNRAELWSTFMSASRLRTILVEVDRVDGIGGPLVPETSGNIGVNGEMKTVEFAFDGFRPGQYQVRMTPSNPVPLTPADVALWNVQIAGCGDGVLQGGEMCDDGDRDPNNGCNNLCVASAGPDPVETMALWRATLRLTTCDRDSAGTDARVYAQWLLDSGWTTPFYLNKPGGRELNRREVDSYDLPLTDIDTVSDIEGLAIQIEGGNAWCMERTELIFNGNSGGSGSNTNNAAFFNHNPGDLERWLDGDGDRGRPNRIEFDFATLRGDSLWNASGERAGALTPPELIKARSMTDMLMAAIGDELKRRGRVEWEGGDNDVIFITDGRSGSSNNIRVDIDLERDVGRREIDADFRLTASCVGSDFNFDTSDLDIDHTGVSSAGQQARRAMEAVLSRIYPAFESGLNQANSGACSSPQFEQDGDLNLR